MMEVLFGFSARWFHRLFASSSNIYLPFVRFSGILLSFMSSIEGLLGYILNEVNEVNGVDEDKGETSGCVEWERDGIGRRIEGRGVIEDNPIGITLTGGIEIG